MTGFQTLFCKEWLRFWKVRVQTVLAPVLTALLYLLVFGHALSGRVEVFPCVEYTTFLIPGLAMMSVLQNSFANGSSSLMQSKMTGNIVFVLLPPLSHREFFAAYLLAAVGRGVVVGSGVLLATLWFVDLPLAQPLWILLFGIVSSAAFLAPEIATSPLSGMPPSITSLSIRSKSFFSHRVSRYPLEGCTEDTEKNKN